MIFSDKEIPASTREKVSAFCRRRRLPQSVLLTGSSAKKREKAALELANAALCESPKADGQPCLSCAACRKVKAGSHPDIIRVEPEKDHKSVSVVALREQVLESLWIAPNEGNVKVYVFPDADNLSDVIQNALLKTIEEPPAFAMFLFLARSRDNLLPTVLSRVTELTLGDELTAERKGKEEEEIRLAAAILEAFCRGSEYDLMIAAAPMAKNRALMQKIADRVTLAVRDALALGAAEPLSGCEREAILLRKTFPDRTLIAVCEVMALISQRAGSNANENLLLSAFSAELAALREKTE
ncbi:MAG: hypothetical protein IK104_11360 [Clostridia bacterium]|nr:hypothetical protein [Clostridia bacterium]